MKIEKECIFTKKMDTAVFYWFTANWCFPKPFIFAWLEHFEEF